ncbi:MAG: long-chain fatty acid--CoA ligase [Gemmatimonadales bacterium]
MQGLMMDYQLTIPALVHRAEQYHRAKAIVDRRSDGTAYRTTYGELLDRAHRLAGALRALGVAPGDRVGTFCWNHHQHLEAYYAVPSMGAVLHTLNIRLHADELTYIANHAGDRVVIVDSLLLPAFNLFRDRLTTVEQVIVVDEGTSTAQASTDGDSDLRPDDLDYEALLAGATPLAFESAIDERQAAAMCYTSGTTGRPKGVVYSHRSTVLHALTFCMADLDAMRESDRLLAIVPLFHACAWGTPYGALMMGTTQIMPGPHPEPVGLLELLSRERVTVALGVPAVLTAVLQQLAKSPDAYDLSKLRLVLSGGSAVPRSLIRAFDERLGIELVHLWGMTETSPLASHARCPAELADADADTRLAHRATQGRATPLVEIRASNDKGVVPWDGETMGEMEVRCPWIVSSYYDAPESGDRFTADGWFRTGDIATIDAKGAITLRDRSKDVIKSGGEWISSIALENALLDHAAVSEAAVVGVPHPKWDERPVALIVPREGASCTGAELREFLAPRFPKWWVPDGIEFVEKIPRSSVGKVLKRELREQYAGYYNSVADR